MSNRTTRIRRRIGFLCLLAGVVLVLVCLPAEAQPRKIVVGAGDSFTPLMFKNSLGEPDGLDVDLWKLWSEKTGIEVEIRLMPWAETIPALRRGEVDVVDGVTLTPDRDRYLDFSAPYGEIATYIYFHESLGGVRGLEGLHGFVVGVLAGTNVEEKIKAEHPAIHLDPFANHEEIIRAARAGEVRAFLGEEPMVPYFFAKAGDTGGFRRADEPILSSELRMAVREGESELLAVVSRGLAAITPDERRELKDRWSGVGFPPNIPWRWIFVGAAALLFLGVGLLAWNRTLRHRVAAATRTLRESEERFRHLVETTSDWIWEVDAEGRYTYASPRVKALLGYEPAELIGKSPLEVMPAEEAARVRPIFGDLLAKRLPIVSLENRCRHKDGRILVLETSGLPILSTTGRFLGYRGVDRDITARKHAEEELWAEKIFSDRLINSLPGIFYLFPEDGPLSRWNQHLATVSGYSDEELSRMSPLDWFARDEKEAVADRISEVFSDGNSSIETNLRLKSGERVPYFLTGSLLIVEDRRYLLGVGIDVSERESLEAQLRHSQKMEGIGRLAGGVAHDFNNLLQAIRGYTEISLAKVAPDHPVETHLNEVIKAVERASTLTRQLLTFSRREALKPERLDLNDVIGDLSRMLRRLIGEDIEFVVRSQTGLRAVEADPGQVEQILMNLCVNARDAMPDGGRLTIETANVDLDEEFCQTHPWAEVGAYVLLSVADTGAGIPVDIRERIFEPFFTTKGVGEGTGLGLATVYAIVERHGGMIDFVSSPEEGTEFRIHLRASSGTARARLPAVEDRSLCGNGELILIAEDDELVRNLALHVLEDAGYRILVAENGRLAIDRINERGDEIAAAIVDVVMPEVGGREVHDVLSRRSPPIPTLFSSGYGYDELVKDGVLPLNSDLLQKPYSPKDLLARLRALLDGPA